MKDPFLQHTLSNGLRVVVETMPHVRSAAAGFQVLTGARDEVAEMAGVSHFLEHMMFKGTEKRGWQDITIDFDRMGSTYNAYTSEDHTVYYGWVRAADIERQLELLADMLRSVLPAEEFDTERKVILEEIAMSKDSHEHLAYDFIQARVFAGHPLAWPVLGYEQTVAELTRDQMWAYFKRRYAPGNVMLVVAGNVDAPRIVETAEALCGDWEPVPNGQQTVAPEFRTGTDALPTDRFNQQIVALTFPAASATDPMTESADAAAAILGGSNSRFYWNIVQAGVSSQAGAYHVAYGDCGLMILSGTCQPEKAERLLDSMRTEASTICNEKVAQHEVERVKNKRRTSLAAESEVPYQRLSQIMDDMHYRGRPRTVDEVLADVDAISPATIHDHFQRYPIDKGGHLAGIGPRDWPR